MTADQRADQSLCRSLGSPAATQIWKNDRRIDVRSQHVPGVLFQVRNRESYVILQEGTVPTRASVSVHWPMSRPATVDPDRDWWLRLVELTPCTAEQREILRSFVCPGVAFELCLWFLGPTMPGADEALGYKLMLETNETALWTAGLTHWTWQPARLPIDLPPPLMPPIDRGRRGSPSDRRFFEWTLGGHTYVTRRGDKEDGWATPRTIRHLMTQGFTKRDVASAVGLGRRIDLYWDSALKGKTSHSAT